ncbi:hypothetical protein LOTGIDRAFT_175294 [Lottia gigantea]|uniref:MIF4G domain-containing protein n=1 Tax=Lottia gigantea TaxID=225164 RepID=V4AJM8_LOTGI|nr:hypothetical protein LOTGIDRAFT_175294 [Lottia gigantea]ESO94905.1 hypothetical protein LOTGIDRAFT_175294 [Lottia gigantea]
MNHTGVVGGGGKGDGPDIVASKPPLREPKDATLFRLVNVNGVPNAGSGDSLTSNLSAAATSFVPSSFSRPNTEPTLLPELTSYNYVMLEFDQMIEILISQPGNMEEYMKRSLSHLLPVESTDILDSMVHKLYFTCINEPNFRYTGARICQYFNSNESLKSHPVFKNFRTTLLTRCKKDYDARESHLQSNNEQLIQGLAMFMSELFLNLEVIQPDGRMAKFDILASSLKDIVLSLLNYPTDKNIKCCVQMLKLSGSSIEDSLIRNGNSLDDVINCLASLQNSANISENSKFMIKSVLDLRCNNWGRSDSVSSAESLSTDFNNLSVTYENEPIYYDVKGQEISRSEAGCPDDSLGSAAYLFNEEEDDFLNQAEAYFNPDTYAPWSNDNFIGSEDLSGSEDYTVTEIVDQQLTNEVIDAYEAFLQECQDKKS